MAAPVPGAGIGILGHLMEVHVGKTRNGFDLCVDVATVFAWVGQARIVVNGDACVFDGRQTRGIEGCACRVVSRRDGFVWASHKR